MKTPFNIGGNNLTTFLQQNTEFLMAELYNITLVDGTIIRTTTWSKDLTVNFNKFSSNTPQFKRTTVEEKIGTDVSEIKVTLIARATDQLGGVSILAKVVRGDFDNATIKVERLYMDSNGTQIGTFVRFFGLLGDAEDVGRSSATFTAKSYVEQLANRQLPTILIQPTCTNTLYDSRCTVNKASFTFGSSVASGSTINVINCGLAQAAGYFDNGQLVVTSGVNNGQKRSIKSYTPGVIILDSPLFSVPGIGDNLSAIAGCDKLQATCSGKFSNLANFAGFPYVPQPEQAI